MNSNRAYDLQLSSEGRASAGRHRDYSYTVRMSQRARYPQIVISARGDIEVVVPQRLRHLSVPGFVGENIAWIEKKLRELEEKHFLRRDETSPARVTFSAIGESWRIEYRESSRNSYREVVQDVDKHVLIISSTDENSVTRLLSHWLSIKAKKHLISWFHSVSVECALPYARITVRAQKTRWGSCSQKQRISINRGLLFLPPELVRYLFIHELCHTRHLNHSRAYWSFVGRYEPDYKILDSRLSKAICDVPPWAMIK